MNGRDMIAVLEWAKAFNKDKPVRVPKVKKPKEKDFFSELIEMQEKMKQFNSWLKDQEKLNKKEEKKKDEGMSVVHLTMMFIILSTLTGPLNVYMIGRMLGKW